MRFQMRKCSKCNNYSLKIKCKNCLIDTITVHPAKFSPDDKYFRYRIMEKYSNQDY